MTMEEATSREAERAVMLEAVREAGRICRSIQAALEGATLVKDDRSPVTVADFASQALICRQLKRAFPADPVIAEEDAAALREPGNAALLARVKGALEPACGDASELLSWIDHGGARASAPRFWTLDPIDGTKGFLRGDQYAVALALIVEGVVELGALACPNLSFAGGAKGQVVYAQRGGGAWLLELDGEGAPQRLAVSDCQEPAQARICESVESGHSSHGAAAQLREALGVRAPAVRIDSQAKYAMLGRGAADVYLRLPTSASYVEKIWDHAAGALVVMEAGGRVSDLRGRPLDFGRGARLEGQRGVIVTNGPLHEPILAGLAELGIS